uniref:girdin-like n=1 Tax=Myxine glutinosa TaxID=7769 RepID=UPI00358E287C
MSSYQTRLSIGVHLNDWYYCGQERDAGQWKLEELLLEKLAIEAGQQQHQMPSSPMWDGAQKGQDAMEQNLALEVQELMSSRVLKLEQENHYLKRAVAAMSNTHGPSSEDRVIDSKNIEKMEVFEILGLAMGNNKVDQTDDGNTVGEDKQRSAAEGNDSKTVSEEDPSGHGKPPSERQAGEGRETREHCTKSHQFETQRVNKERFEKAVIHSEEQRRAILLQLQQSERECDELRESARELKWKHEEDRAAAERQLERVRAALRSAEAEKGRLDQARTAGQERCCELQHRIADQEQEANVFRNRLEEQSRELEEAQHVRGCLETKLEQESGRTRAMERDARRLRLQVEARDTQLEDGRAIQAELEHRAEEMLRELERERGSSERLRELESQSRESARLAALDRSSLDTLRADLVRDKLYNQEMSRELEVIEQELQTLGLERERLVNGGYSSVECKSKISGSEIMEFQPEPLIDQEKEQVALLERHLEEARVENLKLVKEVETMRQGHEALKKSAVEDETEKHVVEEMVRKVKGDHYGGKRETCQSVWPDGTESATDAIARMWSTHEATLELLKLKDRLIDVERNNASLQAESKALTVRCQQAESQAESLATRLSSHQEQGLALHAHNVQLQVENATLKSQVHTLASQVLQLQESQALLEVEAQNQSCRHQELHETLDTLVQDHERLEVVHRQQAVDYETLISKHADLKTSHRSLEAQHREQQDRYTELLQQQESLLEQEKELQAKRECLKIDTKRYSCLEQEHKFFQTEHERLCEEHGHLKKQLVELEEELHDQASEQHKAQLEKAKFQADYASLKEEYQAFDINNTKMENHCELLSQLKGNLEEENKQLQDQMQSLMVRNQELMDQTMESKDMYIEEQKQYLDKLNELRWQKDRLEEKIMNQYRFLEPLPKRKSNWLDKMKKLMKTRKDNLKEKVRSQLDLSTLGRQAAEGHGMQDSGTLSPLDEAGTSQSGHYAEKAVRRRPGRQGSTVGQALKSRRSQSVGNLLREFDSTHQHKSQTLGQQNSLSRAGEYASTERVAFRRRDPGSLTNSLVIIGRRSSTEDKPSGIQWMKDENEKQPEPAKSQLEEEDFNIFVEGLKETCHIDTPSDLRSADHSPELSIISDRNNHIARNTNNNASPRHPKGMNGNYALQGGSTNGGVSEICQMTSTLQPDGSSFVSKPDANILQNSIALKSLSPNSEVVTLQQFLEEGEVIPTQKRVVLGGSCDSLTKESKTASDLLGDPEMAFSRPTSPKFVPKLLRRQFFKTASLTTSREGSPRTRSPSNSPRSDSSSHFFHLPFLGRQDRAFSVPELIGIGSPKRSRSRSTITSSRLGSDGHLPAAEDGTRGNAQLGVQGLSLNKKFWNLISRSDH